jgi:hypothetical protein
MKRVADFALCLSLLAGFGIAAAQEASQAPHQVLAITREFVKPGRGGMMHDKAESAFVQAFARAKWPTHYVGMTSLSGKQRALFFVGYDSFEAWEKDNMAVQKNSTLSAAVDHAGFVDGGLLDSMDASTFVYRPDYSLRPNADLSHRRYMEIAFYQIRQGHRKDWDDAVKMVLAAYQKAMPEAHWACYEAFYGMPEGSFIFLTARTSAAEIDRGFAQDKNFLAAMGEDGMKKLSDLSAAAVESSESNLFAIDPRMSYVADEVIKTDPDFWNAKPAAAPAAHKKAEPKAPAAQ